MLKLFELGFLRFYGFNWIAVFRKMQSIILTMQKWKKLDVEGFIKGDFGVQNYNFGVKTAKKRKKY